MAVVGLNLDWLTRQPPAGARFTVATAEDELPVIRTENGTITSRIVKDKESSVVKVLAGAGQATPPGRSIKRMLQLRYASHLVRSRGNCGCRAAPNTAKAIPLRKASSYALTGTTGVRATAWGERTGRVNWGPSAAGGSVPQPDGISHNQ